MANYQSQYTGKQIDAAVRQTTTNTQDITTETTRATRVENQLAANITNTVNRMRGETTVMDDPFHFKSFSESEEKPGSQQAGEWLDKQCTTDFGVNVPVGIIRIRINGSYVLCINNVKNYANGEWTQTLLNAYVNGDGHIFPSIGIYVRESSLVDGEIVWTPWKRFLTTDDL